MHICYAKANIEIQTPNHYIHRVRERKVVLMGSPAPKSMSPEIAAALAAAAKKTVTKLPVAAASNLKKSKYVGKKALKGVTSRFNCAAYSL